MTLIFLAASNPASRMTLNSVGSAASRRPPRRRRPGRPSSPRRRRPARSCTSPSGSPSASTAWAMVRPASLSPSSATEAHDLGSFQNRCRVKRPGEERNSWLGQAAARSAGVVHSSTARPRPRGSPRPRPCGGPRRALPFSSIVLRMPASWLAGPVEAAGDLRRRARAARRSRRRSPPGGSASSWRSSNGTGWPSATAS